MELTGIHLLVTYRCNLACEHCFVWGSPRQIGTVTLEQVRNLLQQAKEMGTVTSVYFEGGEPFLYYELVLAGARRAVQMGFEVGLVTNAFWASSLEKALEKLRPLAGLVQDLTLSCDLYHNSSNMGWKVENAQAAARQLDIPVGVIRIARPGVPDAQGRIGQLPEGESAVMFRGRAALELAPSAPHHPWLEFTACPHEDLRDPGRVHLDAFGYVQLCQGISLGNTFQRPLGEICAAYDPQAHPITGPLLSGGPVELVRRYGLPHRDAYADACHLCYQARLALRPRFPEILAPDQVYGFTSTTTMR